MRHHRASSCYRGVHSAHPYREENYNSCGERVREVHDIEMQRRKIEHLVQENAALEANLSKERSEFDLKITEMRYVDGLARI